MTEDLRHVNPHLEHLPETVLRGVRWLNDALGDLGLHEVTFFCVLLLAYPLGYLHCHLSGTTLRHVYSVFWGLLFGYIVYGALFIHCILLPGLGYALVFLLPPRFSAHVNCFVSMAYLSICNIMRHDEYRFDFTMALMVATVKTITFGYNYSDGCKLKAGKPLHEIKSIHEEMEYCSLNQAPSLLEFFSFILFYGGLITGPCIEISHYLRSMNRSIFRENGIQGPPKTVKASLLILLKGLACFVGYFCIFKIPTKAIQSELFKSQLTFFEKIMYSWASVNIYRWQFFLGFLVAEGGCVSAGLGFNEKQFRKDGNMHWDYVNNVHLLQVELGRSAPQLTNNWNKGVNRWLKYYVYLRVDPPKIVSKIFGGKKFLALVITRTVSAFWHGFYWGYYLFFLFAVLVNSMDTALRKFFFRFVIYSNFESFFRYICFLLTNFTMSYIGVSFATLDAELALSFWSSTYFIGHVVCLGVVAISQIVDIMIPVKDNAHSLKIKHL